MATGFTWSSIPSAFLTSMTFDLWVSGPVLGTQRCRYFLSKAKSDCAGVGSGEHGNVGVVEWSLRSKMACPAPVPGPWPCTHQTPLTSTRPPSHSSPWSPSTILRTPTRIFRSRGKYATCCTLSCWIRANQQNTELTQICPSTYTALNS